jgi:hypothetical protein
LPRLVPGRAVRGTLTERDSECGAHHCDVFRYQARAGEELTITLRSGHFDAFLSLYEPEADGNLYEAQQADQGFEVGLDSRLISDVQLDGPVYVVATMSPREDRVRTGHYTLLLTVRRALPPR